MADNRALHVEVDGGEIIITAPGTNYLVIYHRVPGEPGLIVKSSSGVTNKDVPMTHAEFLTRAWKLANDKARELGWIV